MNKLHKWLVGQLRLVEQTHKTKEPQVSDIIEVPELPEETWREKSDREWWEVEQKRVKREEQAEQYKAKLLKIWNDEPDKRLVDGWFILQSGKELGFVVEPGVAKILRESVMNDDFEDTKIRFINYEGACWVSLHVDSIVSVIERRDSKVVLYEGECHYI